MTESGANIPTGRRGHTAAVAGLMVGLLLALVILLAGVFVWQGQRDVRSVVETRATSAVFTASAYVRWLIEANLQALRRVADSVAMRPDLLSTGTIKDLNDAVVSLPAAVHIWVVNERGDPVLSNEPGVVPEGVDSQDYFIALRDGAPSFIGRLTVDAATGRRFFPIGRRIEREGRFLGSVLAFVPADLLARFWAAMDLGPGSTVGLLRDDGWLVARFPVPDRSLNLADYVLFSDYLPKAPEGVYQAAASPADGVARLVAYRRMDDLPLVIVVGVPLSTLADSAARRLGGIMLVTAPISVALLLVSLWVVKLLRQEERARGALADALEQNRLLFREIHHRVKNNLQTVAALVQIQPGPADAKDELIRRIAAMTAVHEHIYSSDQYRRVDLAGYIRRLVSGVQHGYGSAITVDCELAPVLVNSDRALPLGLVVNEVVSNAFKHAFPDGRAGSIRVTLRTDGRGQVELRVLDDGVGYRPGTGDGMGSRLIRGLCQQIGAKHTVEVGDGTVFALVFSLTDGDAADEAAGSPDRA